MQAPISKDEARLIAFNVLAGNRVIYVVRSRWETIEVTGAVITELRRDGATVRSRGPSIVVGDGLLRIGHLRSLEWMRGLRADLVIVPDEPTALSAQQLLPCLKTATARLVVRDGETPGRLGP